MAAARRAADHRLFAPHFGAFDRFPVGVTYARNFFDTDQRLLRPLLEAITVPTLILHGEEDFLVPVQAAREHARIVPQAELVVLPEQSHFLPWSATEDIARRIGEFATEVEQGGGIERASADPARVGSLPATV